MDFINLKDLNHYNYKMQPKLNGIFAHWNKRTKTFKTKTGLEITTVPHLNRQLSKTPATTGELYSHGLSFQKINKAVMSGAPDSAKIEFHPFSEIRTYHPESMKDLSDTYHQFLADGYEGAVLTDENGSQFKVKPHPDTEAVIIGFNPGTGKNKSTFGSLILELPNGKQFSCSGISNKDRLRIHKRKPLGELVTVIYDYLSDDGIPISPRFDDFRFDMRGGSREGSGRKEKPKTERRDIRKLYRWTRTEHEAIRAASKQLNLKESELVRMAVANLIKSQDV